MLLADEFFDEDFIAFWNIDFGVRIKSAAGSDATDARRGLAPLLREVAAGAQFTPHVYEVILRAFERGLDGILFRMIGAEPRTQQAVNAFGIGLDGRCVTGDDAPSNAPSGDEIVFRHAAEGDARHVGRDRGEGNVRSGVSLRIVIENQFVVDFIGEDYETVPAGKVGDLLEHLPRAERSRRIIRIDQNNRAGAGRELAFDVGKFGLPSVVFVQVVGVDGNAQLAQNGRVERIVGLRRENVLARIHQGADAEIDCLAYAGGDEDVADGRDAFARGLAANCFKYFGNSGRGSVSVLAVAHGLVSGFDDVRWSMEVEVERVADVQGQYFVALCDDFVGHAGEVANSVADIVETPGGGYFAGLRGGHRVKNEPLPQRSQGSTG